jgi:hypothetical protein
VCRAPEHPSWWAFSLGSCDAQNLIVPWEECRAANCHPERLQGESIIRRFLDRDSLGNDSQMGGPSRQSRPPTPA